MKYLKQFVKFASADFFNGKEIKVLGTAPWVDYNTKALEGTVIEAVIYQDKTKYSFKDGDTRTNQFEKITIKIKKENVVVPAGASIEIVNPVCTIYGDYGNQLSIKADDVRVLTPAKN